MRSSVSFQTRPWAIRHCHFLKRRRGGRSLRWCGGIRAAARSAASAAVQHEAARNLDNIAGMPLFAHAGREKITPPPLPVPLKLIKFSGSKTKKNRSLRCSSAGSGWFLPVLRFCLFCSAKQAKTRGNPLFCPHFAVLSVFFLFSKTLTPLPPEFIKFPMPAVRHENKANPAMGGRLPIRHGCSERPNQAATLLYRTATRS